MYISSNFKCQLLTRVNRLWSNIRFVQPSPGCIRKKNIPTAETNLLLIFTLLLWKPHILTQTQWDYVNDSIEVVQIISVDSATIWMLNLLLDKLLLLRRPWRMSCQLLILIHLASTVVHTCLQTEIEREIVLMYCYTNS